MRQGPLYRAWHTVVCCASGPSFSAEQAALVIEARASDACRVIVVNNQYQTVPTADALYSGAEWWPVYIGRVRALGFAGELWTQYDLGGSSPAKAWRAEGVRLGLHQIASIHGDYLPADPAIITQGGNSGFQAIGLAARFGAQRIVLVGYDMQRTDGRRHNHADHAPPLSNGNPKEWVKHFDVLASDLVRAGVHVVNASAATALTCFERMPLREALEYHEQVA